MAAITKSQGNETIVRTFAFLKDKLQNQDPARSIGNDALSKRVETIIALMNKDEYAALIDSLEDKEFQKYFDLAGRMAEVLNLPDYKKYKDIEIKSDISKLSYTDKIEKAISYSNVIDEILEEIGDIRLLAVQMAAVAGVMIALAATGYGAAAEALGFVFLAVGAAMSGTQLLSGIIGLGIFFTTVDEAKNEADLKKCGEIFGDSVAKIGVDGLFFVLSMFGLKKASAKLTTKTVVNNGINANKWKGKEIVDEELKFGEETSESDLNFNELAKLKEISGAKTIFDETGKKIGVFYSGDVISVDGQRIQKAKGVLTAGDKSKAGIEYKFYIADDGNGHYFKVLMPDFDDVKIVNKTYKVPHYVEKDGKVINLWKNDAELKKWCKTQYIKDLKNSSFLETEGISKNEAILRIKFEEEGIKFFDYDSKAFNDFITENKISLDEVYDFLDNYDRGEWHHLASSGDMIYVPKGHGSTLAPHTGGNKFWCEQAEIKIANGDSVIVLKNTN